MASRATGHIRNNAVAYLALFFALGGGAAWAAQADQPKSVERSETLTFSADGVEHELFTIGGSTLTTRCTVVDEPGPEEGGISREISVAAGPEGAVVVHEKRGEQFFEELPPNHQEPIQLDAVPPGGVNPVMMSFTVFDGGGTSASGTAALLADPDNERCTTTAQAAG